MKKEIGAAILEKRFSAIQRKGALARIAGVDFLQIDICDGVFVPSQTFARNARCDSFGKLATLSTFPLELDMMVRHPEHKRWITGIRCASPQRIVIHADSTDSWNDIFSSLSQKIAISLGVHHSTSLSYVNSLIHNFPFAGIQVMGIERIGFGGQPLTPHTFSLIRSLHEQFPKLPISVDGGVKVDNAARLFKAGATRLVSGSGIFHFPAGADAAVAAFRRLT